MSKLQLICGLAILSASLSNIVFADQNKAKSLSGPCPPAELTPAAVSACINDATNPYTDWNLLQGTTANHTDPPNSHNDKLTIRVNDIAHSYLQQHFPFKFQPYKKSGSNFLRLPAGSVLVKTASTMQDSVTVMVKPNAEQITRCSYPQCQNGWYFVSFKTRDPASSNNQAEHCIACHTGAYGAEANSSKYYGSAKYMLSEADFVWSIFYQMVVNINKP